MKQHFHITNFLLLSAALLLGAPRAANAQTTYPIPYVTTVAGLAAGSGNTLCTTGYIKNAVNVNTGDNCLPTQATLISLYDAEVDAAGNVYISENGTNDDIRVIYNGGAALTTLLEAANPSVTAPITGHIYTLAGGLTAAISTKSGSNYLCGNITGGIATNNSRGDGCPAAEAYIKPRGFAIDQYGNIFMTSNGGGNFIRVIYNGGAAVANLIITENPGSTIVNASNPPKVGYLYTIAGTSISTTYVGDGGLANAATFVQLRYLAVDSSENIYISDATTGGGATEAAGNAVREINGTTGIINTVVGMSSCDGAYSGSCPTGNASSGVPAQKAPLNSPYALFVDSANNLYLADYYNSVIRVLYNTPGSNIPGLGSNLTQGDLYTVVGGGTVTSTAPAQAATSIKFADLYVAGIDHAGNLYAEDGTTKYIWRIDAGTGLGTIIAGGAGTTTALPKLCASNTTQTYLDDYGDGCPATQAAMSDTGTISFDPYGNFYIAESSNGIVRELSYNNLFPAVSTGNSASQSLAFEVPSSSVVPTATDSLMGASTTEFSTAVGSACTATGAQSNYEICLASVTFSPLHAGLRAGSLILAGATSSITENLSGVGQAADLAIDAGTQSTLGTGLTPAGVATDSNGNVYVSDTKSNSVFVGAATGTTLTALVTGLTKPTALAVDNSGNVYIANTGSNAITEVSSAGPVVATLGSGLSSPQGVAVDGLGNVYVADTGNNRIVRLYANGYQSVAPIVGLSSPKQLAFDASGNLYIVDSGNSRIVKYSNADGQSTVSLGNGVVPTGVAVDPAGDIYVTDGAGKQLLVYSVGAAAGTPLLAGLGTPVALAADTDANLFIADSTQSGAVELRRSLGDIVLPLADVSAATAQTTSQSIGVTNVGNTALAFTGSSLATLSGANSGLFSVAPSSSNGCSSSTSYTPGSACNFTASFTPTGTGDFSATAFFNTNATNSSTAQALLTGTGKFLIATTTTLSITSPVVAPYYYGQSIVLMAGLTPASLITSNGTQTFTYSIDGQSQASPVPTSQNTLSLNPAAGSHVVSVTYNSDGTYATSSATVNYAVLPAVTTTKLTATPISANGGVLQLQFTATVSAPTATGETGTVSFYSGTTLIATASVGAGGVATYLSGSLSFPTNSFYAVYTPAPINGALDFTTSTSATVTPVADFAIGIQANATSVVQRGVGSLSFNIASLYGSAGTITPSCTGLPANSICRFQPETIALGSTAQVETVLIYTNVSSTLAQNDQHSNASTIAWALGFPLCLGLLLRKRSSRIAVSLGALGLACLFVSGLSGCGKNNVTQSSSNTITPPGTYAVGVVFAGSNGISTTHTATVSLTVIQDSGAF